MQVAAAVIPGATDAGAVRRRHQAFQAAIAPLLDVVYRVLRRFDVRDREIDDALQTVLLIANRHFDELATPQDLKAYVCAAYFNVARDVGRQRPGSSAPTSLSVPIPCIQHGTSL